MTVHQSPPHNRRLEIAAVCLQGILSNPAVTKKIDVFCDRFSQEDHEQNPHDLYIVGSKILNRKVDLLTELALSYADALIEKTKY